MNWMIAAISPGTIHFSINLGAVMTGFLLQLGIWDSQYGLVVGLPLLSDILQVIASYALERMRRRENLLIIAGVISRVCWILIALTPVILPGGRLEARIWYCIGVSFVSFAAGSASGICYLSLLGD
jgi:hypothetical protein